MHYYCRSKLSNLLIYTCAERELESAGADLRAEAMKSLGKRKSRTSASGASGAGAESMVTEFLAFAMQQASDVSPYSSSAKLAQ